MLNFLVTYLSRAQAECSTSHVREMRHFISLMIRCRKKEPRYEETYFM